VHALASEDKWDEETMLVDFVYTFRQVDTALPLLPEVLVQHAVQALTAVQPLCPAHVHITARK